MDRVRHQKQSKDKRASPLQSLKDLLKTRTRRNSLSKKYLQSRKERLKRLALPKRETLHAARGLLRKDKEIHIEAPKMAIRLRATLLIKNLILLLEGRTLFQTYQNQLRLEERTNKKRRKKRTKM